MGSLYGSDLRRGSGKSMGVSSAAFPAGALTVNVGSVLTGTVGTLRLRSNSFSDMSSLQRDQQRVEQPSNYAKLSKQGVSFIDLDSAVGEESPA